MGVTLVTHERGFYVPPLDWWKVYLDSCASHCQLFRRYFLYGEATTQVALHSSSNGEPSTSNVTGTILGAFPCWLVESRIANLISVGAVEQLGCKVEKCMSEGWSLTSPTGIRIQFRLDTGRCRGFSYVDLRDPNIQHLFSKIAEELVTVVNNTMVANRTHVDASFCEYGGLLTADVWLTDTEEHVGGVTILEAGRAKLNKILSTVQENFKGLTKRDIKEAILARTTQSRVGNMSDQKFK